jgi:hypothetical protein
VSPETKRKRLTATILSAIGVCVMAWIAGFDFDERGATAFFVAAFAIVFPIFVYTCPLWSNRT